jgi:hypothetical protein
MNIRSAKAKGARLCKELRDGLLATFSGRLVAGDIAVTASSVPGPDLYLSPRARDLLGMQFECKNQETLQLNAALHQAQSHCRGGEIPVLVFRRNRAGTYAVLPIDAFLNLLGAAKRETGA